MGLAIAGRLAAATPVTAYDPDQGRSAPAVARGVSIAVSPEEVARSSATVVLSLPAPAISSQVIGDVLGEWAACGRTGGTIVETSTITPDDAVRSHRTCAAAGASFVDAAILSGVKPVEAGTSALLIGGDDAAVAAAQAVLDAICPQQRRMGGPGSGMAAKVINNAVAHAVYVVLAEAVAMGAASGVGIETLVELLSDPDGGLLRPLTHRIGERLADRDFDGGMSTEAARKDSVLALAMAHAAKVPLFAIQAAHTVYELGLAAGLGREDYAAVATLWDTWSRSESESQQ
jgi:3-hydroxyisobutyrate dehydrogenase-like beta-hydroxyacid dehydrogenase